MFNTKTPEEKTAKAAARQAKRAERKVKAQEALFKLQALDLNISIKDGQFQIYGQPSVPVAGCTVTVDHGQVAKRITATRVLAVGIFALALKKDNTKLFVTLEGADGSIALQTVPAKKEPQARQFAAMVNNAKVGTP